jgi:hypothetical protein
VFVFLLLLGTLAGCSDAFEKSQPQKQTVSAAVEQILQTPTNSMVGAKSPIQGLFGLKLDKPLPSNCKIISRDRMENGKLAEWILLKQTNAPVNKYWVTFDASDHVVAWISGDGFINEDSKDTKNALLAALRQRYGTNDDYDLEKNGYEYYRWHQGQFSLRFWFGVSNHWSIACSDDRLVNH